MLINNRPTCIKLITKITYFLFYCIVTMNLWGYTMIIGSLNLIRVWSLKYHKMPPKKHVSVCSNYVGQRFALKSLLSFIVLPQTRKSESNIFCYKYFWCHIRLFRCISICCHAKVESYFIAKRWIYKYTHVYTVNIWIYELPVYYCIFYDNLFLYYESYKIIYVYHF